jgi:thiamine transport system permease protein
MNKSFGNVPRFSRRTFIYCLTFILFYLPVVLILGKAFLTRGAFPHMADFVGSRLFLNTLSFSVKEAFLSAFFSLLLALPGAYFFGRYEFPGKKVMRSIMVLPFMFPGIMIVLAMVIFYGHNGVFNHLIYGIIPDCSWKFGDLYGFWGIILAHVFYNFTFCLRILGESWQRIDPRFIDASKILGANFFHTWWRITFPLLMPTVGYLFVLVFLYSFLSFTIVLVFGGYLYKTFEVLIYIDYNQKLDFNRAAIIAMVQTMILATVLYLQSFLGRRARHLAPCELELPQLNLKRLPVLSSIFYSYLISVTIFLLGPFLAILSRSFNEGGTFEGAFTLINYRLLFSDGFRFAVGKNFSSVLSSSISIAIIVTLITVVTAYWFARDRRKLLWRNVDLWLQLPLGISFLTFAFGLLILAGKYLPTWVLVIWAQVFMIFPLIYSLLKTARGELAESLLEAAATLGASPKTIFRTVEFPLMKKSIVTAITYAMALSLGELTAALVLGKGDLVTIPVAIYRLMGHYRFPQATALGSLFILAAFLLFISFELFKHVEGE